jgi:hypothetical protein
MSAIGELMHRNEQAYGHAIEDVTAELCRRDVRDISMMDWLQMIDTAKVKYGWQPVAAGYTEAQRGQAKAS